MESMTYIAYVGLITASISAFMGLLVYLVEKKSTINTLVQVSFLSVFALGLTVFFVSDEGQNIQTVTRLWRIGYLGILFTPPIIVHIIHLILGLYAPTPRNLLATLYGVSTFFGVALFSGFVLYDISFTTWGYYDPNADILGYIFIIFLFLALGYGGTLCLWYYRDISSIQRGQIFGLFLALVFGGLGAFFFYLPDFGITDYQWGTIFLAGYPGFMGYAILKYQFFDISNAFLRVFRLLGSIILGGVIFAGILWFIFGGDMLSTLINTRNIFLYLLGAIFWFLIYKSKFAHTIANPKEKQKLIAMIGTFLADTHPYDTVESLEKTLQKYLSDFVVTAENVRIFDRVTVHRYAGLLGYFTKHTTPITRTSEVYKNYADELDAEIIFPLYSEKEHVIGLLLLGPKADRNAYSQEDVDIISRILLKLSLSLQVLSHNLDLRLEVLKQTGELRKKNDELAAAYEDLKKVDKQKDAFLAIASHELRTPMTIIKGYSDMLLKGTFGNLTESQAKYMTQIFENTENLIKFVNNILDISKLEAGRMVFTYKTFSHKNTIRSLVENFMTLYNQKSISLTLTDETTHDTIEGDESKIVLVMNNLLSNAYKFTNNDGSVVVTLRDKKKINQDILEIEVKDTGIGMDDETQKHIFEKYNQSDNQEYTKKSIEGSGLGLHLTRQVLYYMNGDISVTSHLGTGTTMIAHIPYNQNS